MYTAKEIMKPHISCKFKIPLAQVYVLVGVIFPTFSGSCRALFVLSIPEQTSHDEQAAEDEDEDIGVWVLGRYMPCNKDVSLILWFPTQRYVMSYRKPVCSSFHHWRAGCTCLLVMPSPHCAVCVREWWKVTTQVVKCIYQAHHLRISTDVTWFFYSKLKFVLFTPLYLLW